MNSLVGNMEFNTWRSRNVRCNLFRELEIRIFDCSSVYMPFGVYVYMYVYLYINVCIYVIIYMIINIV